MKKFLLIAFLAFSFHANAQLFLEHTYDSAATWNTCNGNSNQLMVVDFEVSGERYVRINRCGRQINIYDMTHTLVNTISLNGVPLNSPYNTVGAILYLSENLFDTDAGMEFMYISDSAGFFTTKIFNDNGSLLFTENGCPLITPNIHLQQYPIYNTSAGTKLILSYANGQAKVFGLPGMLTTAIETFNEDLISSQMISNPYPNPTNSSTRIGYTFPEGTSNGEIVFYDLAGNEVKRFKVDTSFDHLLVSTSDIAAGSYYYQLQTAVQNSEGKKLIVIE